MDNKKQLVEVAEKNSNVQHLVNNGPSIADNLPSSASFTPSAKLVGVSHFNISSSSDTLSTRGNQVKIYYIRDFHLPKSVLEKWIDANKKIFDSLPNSSVHKRFSNHGEKWKKASNELLDNTSTNPQCGGDKKLGGTCPLCGSDYDTHLPDHLPC